MLLHQTFYIAIMQSLTIFFVASFALCAYASPAGRIVGGSNAPDGKYPYQVSMRVSGQHHCGGSIISNRYILTAAHCLQNVYPGNVQIYVGSNQLSRPQAIYGVQQLIIHPNYTPSLHLHDIGLIRLSTAITFNNKVRPISFQTVNDASSNYNAVVSGWGRLRAGGAIPENLQEIYLTVISVQNCKRYYSQVQNTHICTYTAVGKGVCNGDSGSPLVANGVQIGIVSFGLPCAVGYPDVFTRVSPYSQWIKQTAL